MLLPTPKGVGMSVEFGLDPYKVLFDLFEEQHPGHRIVVHLGPNPEVIAADVTGGATYMMANGTVAIILDALDNTHNLFDHLICELAIVASHFGGKYDPEDDSEDSEGFTREDVLNDEGRLYYRQLRDEFMNRMRTGAPELYNEELLDDLVEHFIEEAVTERQAPPSRWTPVVHVNPNPPARTA